MRYCLRLKSHSELKRMSTTYKTIREIRIALNTAKANGWGYWKIYDGNKLLFQGKF